MTDNQKRRKNDLLEANRQRELEPDEQLSNAGAARQGGNTILVEAGALRQYRHNDGSDGLVFAYDKEITDRLLANAGAASRLTDERIESVWNGIDGKNIIAGENQLNWNSALRKAFARAIEREVLGAYAGVGAAEPAAWMATDPATGITYFTDNEAVAFKWPSGTARPLFDHAAPAVIDQPTAAEIRTAIPHALESAYARLLQAAKVYSFNYMQDEAEDEKDCVCGPKQHAEAKEVFAAIKEVEHFVALASKEAAPAEVPSQDPKVAQLRRAIETVCEGWTLPSDARKVLETAMWTDPVQSRTQGESGGEE